MIDQLLDRRQLLKGVGAVALGGAAAVAPIAAWAEDDHEDTILSFSTMVGIHAPFLGNAGLAQFRGVHGGGAPWIISEGSGRLRSDGRLHVRVRGLVLDPAFVPAPAGGTNPIPFFTAVVSGFSTDPTTPVNLVTGNFPASKEGDATITATLNLTHPFFAPIIFVASLPLGTPPAPHWFAVTGTS